MAGGLQNYLQENAQHGSPGLPAAVYRTWYPENIRALPSHWHEEMEVTLVTEGELDYVLGMSALRVSQGDLLLIPPDTLHASHLPEEGRAVTESVVFHLDIAGLSAPDQCGAQYLRPLCSGELGVQRLVRPRDDHYDRLLACFTRLRDALDPAEPCRALAVKAAAVELLLVVCRDFATAPAVDREVSGSVEQVKRALAYIQGHYAEPITIEKLADLAGFSQVHFMNIFKKAVGTTCIEYLIEYRLTLAAIELRETEKPVTQIALDHGFQTISYFNRAFRKRYRTTPTAYRRGENQAEEK